MCVFVSRECLSDDFGVGVNQLLGIFDMLSHKRVAERLIFEQIDRPAEKVGEAKLQIEIIVGILQRRFVGDVHDQIHIAFVVKAIGENRTEGKQPLDAVSAAEVSYLYIVLAEEVHGELCFA